MGGLWMAVMMGFVGLKPLGEELAFDPMLPEAWQALAFRLQWRGRVVRVRIDARRRVVAATLERGDALAIRVGRGSLMLDAAAERECSY
jgi:trehalose/maltose hydrolase-like predicted phosphorylase